MVFERLKNIISEQLGIPEGDITMETTIDELDIDSIDAVELIMNIEDEFDIEIPDEEMDNLKNIGDLVHFVEKC